MLKFTITPNKPIDVSVYDPQSYLIENLFTGSTQITGLSLDIANALFQGLVFDPVTGGSSGNDLGKAFTVDLNQGGITVTHSYSKPYDGEIGQVLSLSLGSFNPGDKLAFSADIDPSRLVASDPSAGPQGKMSGLELTGSLVTVTYADGSTHSGEIFGDGTQSGGLLLLAGNLLAAPSIVVQGTTAGTGTLNDNDATISIAGGPANGTVRLQIVRAVYDLFEPALNQFEANRATNVNYVDVALNASGAATTTVDLTFGGTVQPSGGVFHVVGAAVGTQGAPTSLVSDVTRVTLNIPAPDADGDGLSDVVDRFALDATNGSGNNLAQLGTITLGFNSGSAPLNSGFTGLMTNGTQSYTALAASGTVANGKLSVQTTTGDPYGSDNTQQNAYQFGVDTSGVQAFTIEAKVDNPFQSGVAVQNWRGAGLAFGAGDQDNYGKLIFMANGGAGGIEFLVENGGTPNGTTVGLGVPVGNIAYGMLYVDVAKTATGATATPRWTLHDAGGTQIGSGSGAAKALTGDLLDAVQGDLVVNGQQSELAVGVISTHVGTSSPFTAAWDEVKITTATTPPPPAAGVVVTQSGGGTAVAEGGASDTLTVALASAPSADVTVTVSGNADLAVASGSGSLAASTTLSFTPANWNTAQTVTVAAVDDTAVEGPETASLTFSTSSTAAAYNNLTVAPVSVTITDNDGGSPPPAPVVVGGGSALSGSLGAQSWGPLAVSGTGWTGTAALVTSSTDGIGVEGGRFAGQVDYNGASNSSEVLRIGFNVPVDSATLRLSRMNAADAPGAAEVGAWTAFDAAGAVVGQGLLDPRGKPSVAQWTYDFAVDPAADMAAMELRAVAYNNGAPGGSGDNSDFALAQVTYLPADQLI